MRPETKAGHPTNWTQISKALITLRGASCARCQTTADQGKGLTVHHIDGNPTNCQLENLIILCQACHLEIQAWGFKTRQSITQANQPYLPGFAHEI